MAQCSIGVLPKARKLGFNERNNHFCIISCHLELRNTTCNLSCNAGPQTQLPNTRLFLRKEGIT